MISTNYTDTFMLNNDDNVSKNRLKPVGNRLRPGPVQDHKKPMRTGPNQSSPVFLTIWEFLGPVAVPVLAKIAKKPDWTGLQNTSSGSCRHFFLGALGGGGFAGARISAEVLGIMERMQ